VSPYLILGVSMFALFWNLYWLVVRPAVKRNRTATEAVAAPVPEPKIPRDTSRPYPRGDSAATGEILQTCPICGMSDLDQMIPDDLADFFGWPAHASCKEWLGEWEPPRLLPLPAILPYRPDPAAAGYRNKIPRSAAVEISVSDSPGAQINVGDRNSQVAWSESGTTDPVVLMTQRGMISLDETRERLNREIVASWGVPPAILGEHTRKVGDPLPLERCPDCGAQFVGTPDYLRSAYEIHQRTGCRQSLSSPPDGALIRTAHLDPSLGSPTGRTWPYRLLSAPWSRSTMIPARSQALRASATEERRR